MLLLYWEYNVTFTNVLTIYHSCIHPPLFFSFILPSLHSWNSFNRSHLSIFMHEYIIFPPYSSSYTLQSCFVIWFFVLFCFVFIIHICIQGLGHFSPLPPPSPLPPTLPPPSLPHPFNTQQKLFCPISNFVVERV
jgi:hypothetical protein